jgi:hypothetical protein
MQMLSKFEAWLRKANRGDEFIYHKGFLMTDRASFFQLGGTVMSIPNVDIDKTAKLAMEASDNNQVCLVQRKLGEAEYEYVALKR